MSRAKLGISLNYKVAEISAVSETKAKNQPRTDDLLQLTVITGILQKLKFPNSSNNSSQGNDITRKPSWRKGCARQQCVYAAILDFWNFKVAPLVRPPPKTLP